MTEISPEQLRQAVESQHGGEATFVEFTLIHEELGGGIAWDGAVAIFDLNGNAWSRRAYAWSYEAPNGTRQFIAVLHGGAITSARKAVRAAIAADRRVGR